MRTENLKTVLSSSVATLALLGLAAPAQAEVNIGGYIKGDVIYDVDEDLGKSFAASSITADPTPTEDGTVNFHAKQSRFWLKTSSKTESGTLKTHLEVDLEGGGGNEVFSNSEHVRLRHAYGELGGLLVGQTWTNFMSLHSYADTVDFFGPAGMPFIRQAQVRYTFRAGDNLRVAIAIENPEITGRIVGDGTFSSESGGDAVGSTLGDSDAGNIGLDTVPDLTGRIKYSSDLWTGVLSAVIRPGMEIEENDLDAGAVAGDSETGWGVHASFGVNAGPAYLFINGTFGEGIGRYLINGSVNDLVVNAAQTTLTAPAMWAIVPGIDIGWNDKLRSVLVWGHNENSDTFAPGDIDTIDTIHGNLWYQATENARYGIEVVYGTVDFADGTDGDATRLQFAGQFSF